MDTYKQIQKYVKQKHGFVPKPCWIAHTKELMDIPLRKGKPRKGKERAVKCPEDKLDAIKKAIEHFGLLKVGLHP